MIRVLIVDDDPLVRAGLTMILEAAEDLEVVGEAGDGREAIARVREHRPDVLVLTTFHLDEYVFGALDAGASGFALKDLRPRELIEAVRVVHRGDALLSPADTRALIDRYARPEEASRGRRAAEAMAALSPREREVVEAVSRGLTNTEIAAELFCSEATIKAHLTHIFVKLGIDNRVRVAILAHDARE